MTTLGSEAVEEVEECVVDLLGVGPDDRVWAVGYHDVPGVADQAG